jgi:hypothetical protein
MDRIRTSGSERYSAMCAGRVVSFGALLHTAGRIRREPGPDASSGRGIHPAPFLWRSTNAFVSYSARVHGQSKAGEAASPKNGVGSHLCKAPIVKAGTRSSDLSLPAARPADCAAKSSLGERYHLYPVTPWLCVSCGDHGLVQPLCARLGIIGQSGHELLHGGVAMGVEYRQARYLQHGSGSAVHQRSVYTASFGSSGPGQYGRSRSSKGQHLRRTALENGEIRRGLSDGLRQRQRSIRKPEPLFPFLQLRTRPSVLGESDSGSSPFQQEAYHAFRRQTGNDNDRVEIRSPLVGDYSPNFFGKNEVKLKIEGNEPIESLENP